MENLRIWLTTLIEYDKYGNSTVLKSFSKIARDSNVGQAKKKVVGAKKSTKTKSKTGEEKSIW